MRKLIKYKRLLTSEHLKKEYENIPSYWGKKKHEKQILIQKYYIT